MHNMRRAPLAIVSGCARGADMMGELWAQRHNIPVTRFPADWAKYGKSAGAIRNQQMVDYADEFLVFWDGVSPGTKIMIDMIKKSGKHLMLIKYVGDKNGKTKEKTEHDLLGQARNESEATETGNEIAQQPGPDCKDGGINNVDDRVADPHMDDNCPL